MRSTKKLIVFNGSPKTNGETMQLVNQILDNLDKDIEVEVINIFKQNYKPCVDCGYCVTNSKCAINDGFDLVFKKIQEADFYIVASPMWFGTITGPMMSFFSRLQIVSTGILFRKDTKNIWDKGGIFVMTSGSKWLSMMKSVETTAEFVFNHLDALILDFVYATRTDKVSVSENEHVMKRSEMAAEKINRWFSDKYNGKYYKYGYSSVNRLYKD